MSSENTVHLSVAVPEALHKQLRKKCFYKRIPMSKIAVGLLRDWIRGEDEPCGEKPAIKCSFVIDAEVYKKFGTLCLEKFGVSVEEELTWYINECISCSSRPV
jgi:hypothetical protein